MRKQAIFRAAAIQIKRIVGHAFPVPKGNFPQILASQYIQAVHGGNLSGRYKSPAQIAAVYSSYLFLRQPLRHFSCLLNAVCRQ